VGTDGHTDITKLIIAFLDVVKAPNKKQVYTDIKIRKQYVTKMTVKLWILKYIIQKIYPRVHCSLKTMLKR